MRFPMIAEHEIVSLPSVFVLAVLRQEIKHRSLLPKTLAVLADPGFEVDDPRIEVKTLPNEHETAPYLAPGTGAATALQQADSGDFGEIHLNPDPNLVRLKEDVFTHQTHRERAFAENIFGWHLNYHYEDFDCVITETEQLLIPSAHGISVFTQVGLEIERERRKKEERYIPISYCLLQS
jgi:hypothetical protein